MSARRFAVIATTPGGGKSTLARELAARLCVRYVELDSWMHQANWTPLPVDELIARVDAVLATDGWVIDGSYADQLGTRVIEAADIVVWLDMPLRVWFPRLTRRTVARVFLRQELWNGNRETFRGVFWGRDALLLYALKAFVRRRREWPLRMSPFNTVRLRSPAEVRAFLDRVAPADQ